VRDCIVSLIDHNQLHCRSLSKSIQTSAELFISLTYSHKNGSTSNNSIPLILNYAGNYYMNLQDIIYSCKRPKFHSFQKNVSFHHYSYKNINDSIVLWRNCREFHLPTSINIQSKNK